MISRNTVIRISKYKNALNRFRALGLERVFSDNIADAIGGSAAQVRKDFSHLGITGFKKGGYRVASLLERLNELLGKHETVLAIIVGAGKIGRALINYRGFAADGIRIVAGFDSDPAKFRPADPVPLLPLDDLEPFVRANNVRIAILTVPEAVAQAVADRLVEAGIKGILNFAPLRVKTPDHVVVSQVNLVLELENLIYYVNNLE